MAKRIAQQELRELALVGARARYQELRTSLTALLRTFPELARNGGARAPLATRGAGKPGRKKPMTASERRQVSERMTKYWADRRAAKAKAKK